MRWFKKIVRAILALLPLFAIFLIPSNASALQHNYGGLVTGDIILPPFENGHYNFESTSDSTIGTTYSNGFTFEFKGTAWQDYYSRLEPAISTWHLLDTQYFTFENNTCIPDTDGYFYQFGNDFYKNTSANTPSVGIYGRAFVPDAWNPYNVVSCYNRDSHFSYGLPDLEETGFQFNSSVNGSVITLPQSDSLVRLHKFYPPKLWSADGLKLNAQSQSGGGILYSHSFSPTKYFGMGIPTFSKMVIPLYTADGYFSKSENLYQGRHLEFKFLFRFYDGFEWNSDLSNGSIHVEFDHAYTTGGSHNYDDYFDCTANNQLVDGYNLLDITCAGDLEYNYAGIVPVLVIENDDKYVWRSNGEWEFYSAYLTTDYDNTPADRFNDNFTGDMWSPSSDDADNAQANWLLSLVVMFNFSIPNTPLGSILGGFTDSMSCASIPTIASMIHSNETQVCPWFNTTIRNITTPVLSLFAVCLTFGFIVRWLSSSSGNDTVNSGGV